MKTIVTLTDRYQDSLSCNVRVDAIKADDPDYRTSHCATLTEGQIKKVRRDLPNGCRNLNETRINNDGRIVEAEIYFSIDQ